MNRQFVPILVIIIVKVELIKCLYYFNVIIFLLYDFIILIKVENFFFRDLK